MYLTNVSIPVCHYNWLQNAGRAYHTYKSALTGHRGTEPESGGLASLSWALGVIHEVECKMNPLKDCRASDCFVMVLYLWVLFLHNGEWGWQPGCQSVGATACDRVYRRNRITSYVISSPNETQAGKVERPCLRTSPRIISDVRLHKKRMAYRCGR